MLYGLLIFPPGILPRYGMVHFSRMSIDRNGKKVVVYVDVTWTYHRTYIQETTSNFQPGPYLINLITLKKVKIEFPSGDGIYIDYERFPFGLNGQRIRFHAGWITIIFPVRKNGVDTPAF